MIRSLGKKATAVVVTLCMACIIRNDRKCAKRKMCLCVLLWGKSSADRVTLPFWEAHNKQQTLCSGERGDFMQQSQTSNNTTARIKASNLSFYISCVGKQFASTARPHSGSPQQWEIAEWQRWEEDLVLGCWFCNMEGNL